MCGIAGYSLSTTSSFPVDKFYNVMDVLTHRGPDDQGIYQDESHRIGLAHTRLSILDLSSLGHQPIFSHDRRVALVFNGEIYNYCQLKDEFLFDSKHIRGSSDTEVLLNLYLFWRDAKRDFSSLLCLLNGIFSLAIWDADLGEILLARDAFGVKPLYYHTGSNFLSFASEVKALLAFMPTVDDLDMSALNRYLTFLWCPGQLTPLKTVRKVNPGTYLRIKNGSIVSHKTWYRLPVFRASFKSLTSGEAISGVHDYLRASVHRQMVSDVPVGAFLSGGLDSSAVVTFARELNPDLRCFTIDISSSGTDGFTEDLPYAIKVSNHLDLALDIVRVHSSQMASGIEDLVWLLDEPLADPAALNVLFISQLAREQGIKVLLSGVGGDDLFTGYRRHQALSAEHYWAWLPPSIRVCLRELSDKLPQAHPIFRRLRKALSSAHLDGDARLVHYFRWIERADLHALYTPAFRFALGQAQAEDTMHNYLADLPKDTLPLERMLALEQRFFLTDHNLIYTDKMSMAAGVEVRVPFLDLDLVEFAATIPSEYKQRGRQSKWVLKKAMEPYLPYDVIYRPKSGFGAPLRRWLRFELKDWLTDVLSTERLKKRGLFDPQAVHRLIASNAEGRIDASYTLLSLACIEIWCKHFIDQPSSTFIKA